MSATTFSPDYRHRAANQSSGDHIVEALRSQNAEAFAQNSVYAACLLPLLEAFGRKGINRELLEAMPHFARELDLVDLRNILSHLGYVSDCREAVLGDIREEFLPALFVGKNEEVFVVTSKEGTRLHYYDAQRRTHTVSDVGALRLRGRAYLFTDKNPTHGVKQSSAGDVEWFKGITGRFRKMIKQLLLITFVINITALLVPIFIMVIYDKVIGTNSLDSLPMILVGVGILIVADLALRYQKAKALGSVAGRLDYLVGVETFKQLMFLPPSAIERSTVSAQLSRLKQFDSLRDFFTGPSASFVLELPFVLLFIGAVAVLAGPVALVPAVMVILYLIVGMVFRPPLHEKVMRSGKARTDKQAMLMQTFEGRREIKAIGGESLWRERFREVSGEVVHANYAMFVASALMTNISQALMTLSGVAVLAWGAHLVMTQAMTVGALIATMTLAWRVLTPLQGMFLSYSRLQQMRKSISQINSLMRLPIEKNESDFELPQDNECRSLQLDRVSFRYDSNRDPALLGVSFAVQPGELVAVVGFTGSGKSTLLKLIAGLYRPQAGALLLDGVDIRQLNPLALRRSMAYVPQEIRMFHGSIAQNMRLNNCMASDEDLREAADKAGVLEEIEALPEGFDTRLGDNNIRQYPPGFMRSLSIARAFCGSADLVLLDEPGASLDNASDHRFMDQLQQLKGQHTVIMVSHRPSHIRLADRVVFLENGSVSYVGDPQTAIEKMMRASR